MMEADRILLVDDSRMDVELMQEAFLQSEHPPSIHVCPSGQAALEFLQAPLKEGKPPWPDLILLDVKMPGLKGYEVLQRIKQEPRLRRIPVVMMTNSKQGNDISRCYDLGANSYIVKPASFQDLVELTKIIGTYWLQVNVHPPR